MLLEIEVFSSSDIKNNKAQARFIFRGYDDIHWCDNVDTLVATIKYEISKLPSEPTEKR